MRQWDFRWGNFSTCTTTLIIIQLYLCVIHHTNTGVKIITLTKYKHCSDTWFVSHWIIYHLFRTILLEDTHTGKFCSFAVATPTLLWWRPSHKTVTLPHPRSGSHCRNPQLNPPPPPDSLRSPPPASPPLPCCFNPLSSAFSNVTTTF